MHDLLHDRDHLARGLAGMERGGPELMSDEVTQESKDLAAESGLPVQPDPVPTDAPSAHDLVAADLMKRKEFGLRKYGTLLQAGNGRDALQDAYDEVLDLAVYIRTELEERKRAEANIEATLDRFSGPQLAVLSEFIRASGEMTDG